MEYPWICWDGYHSIGFLKIHGDSSDSTISVSENQSDKNGSIFLKINRWDHIETPVYIEIYVYK